jgi:hypothetical protein
LGGGSQDVTTGFTYNPASQIARTTRNNDGYAWRGHYNVTRPYAVNGLNQLTGAGSVTLGYDARGNLTQSGSASYSYTSDNLMTSAPGLTMREACPERSRRDALGRMIDYTPQNGTPLSFGYAA